MTRTPDETKKGLVSCISVGKCWTECPYFAGEALPFTCIRALSADALALIQQKEQENAEQAERIQQLEAERDALYEEVRRCFYCIHADGVLGECDQCCESCEADCPCKECDHYNKFEWRGVQKEG